MEILSGFIDLFLHLDEYLAQIITDYGAWTYGILFVVIFVETGLVVMPFLPGDSLLFAAGTFAALGSLNIWALVGLLIGADFDKTHAFFEKYGGKAIFLARFVPIMRTFAPFVAGIGKMTYGYFITYNLVGGVVWVLLFTFAGYLFGNIPFMKENFEYVIIVIILVSVLPMVFEAWKARREAKTEAAKT